MPHLVQDDSLENPGRLQLSNILDVERHFPCGADRLALLWYGYRGVEGKQEVAARTAGNLQERTETGLGFLFVHEHSEGARTASGSNGREDDRQAGQTRSALPQHIIQRASDASCAYRNGIRPEESPFVPLPRKGPDTPACRSAKYSHQASRVYERWPCKAEGAADPVDLVESSGYPVQTKSTGNVRDELFPPDSIRMQGLRLMLVTVWDWCKPRSHSTSCLYSRVGLVSMGVTIAILELK